MRRLDCHGRIKQLTNHYQTALRTVRAMIQLAELHPEYLRDYDLDPIEMRAVAKQLHDVYFTQLFACFESCLRDYWRTDVRDTSPPTKQLLSSIAARRGVPQNTLDVVHDIRNYRNYLIHEEHTATRECTIDESVNHLNTYIARLPRQW